MKLWRYIQGYRKGKEAHRLEKEAMSDPFLAHALRGFDRVKGDHTRQIEQLRKDVRRKTPRRNLYLRAAGIAASILVVFGLGTYYLVNRTAVPDDRSVAVFRDLQQEPVSTPPQPAIAQQKKIEEKEEEKIIPKAKKVVPRPITVEPVMEEIIITPSQGEHVAMEVSDETIVAEVPISPVAIDSHLEKQYEPIYIRGTAKKDTTPGVTVIRGMSRLPENVLQGKLKGVSVDKFNLVKGTVTDLQGYPIIGASVLVDGTNLGAITDTAGYFELRAPEGSNLLVNYIGYESLKKEIGKHDVLHFAMNEDQTSLDEVVVVGYGTQRKSVLKESKPVDGMKKYKKYLRENMVRPTDGECAEAKGKVVLTFYVDQQGRPTLIMVKESLCPSADQEAIRLLKEGPDWKQGEKQTVLEVEF